MCVGKSDSGVLKLCFPEAVDLMARGLRAGHGVGAVLEMVGQEVADPVGSEFRTMTEEQNLGLPLREAMLNLLDRVPIDDVRFLATAILLQKETGGNLALILDKTASVMRERSRLRGQLRIYTAQGRITGWILCFASFRHVRLDQYYQPELREDLVHDAFGVAHGLRSAGTDGRGCSHHSQDRRASRSKLMTLPLLLGLCLFMVFLVAFFFMLSASSAESRPA